jgi:hypothetical protein
MTTGPGEAIRQRFSTAEAASMAAGCLRGLLKRHGVQLDAEAQRIIQGVLEMVHETLGMDNDGNVVRTAKESATPRLASPGALPQDERELLHALLQDIHAVLDIEAHPALNERINAVLLPCDDVNDGHCKPLKVASPGAKALREAVTLVANSMGDVVTLGRFASSVDPVRLVTAWHVDLRNALENANEALASPAPAAEDGRT